MKSEKLTSFALVIAAVALLIVGAMSYRDYLKAKYEKEFGVAGTSVESAQLPPQAAPAGPGGISAVDALPPAGTPVAPPHAQDAGQIPPMPPALASGNTASGHAATAPPPAALPATSIAAASPPAAAPAADPRISQYQQSLEALRQENSLYREKLEAARNGGGNIPPASIPDTPGREPRLPSSAVAAASGLPAAAPNPLGNPGTETPEQPATQAELSAMAEKVRKEASIAKVTEYDRDWAFLILDGGRDVGIELDMRFAVRRGGEILGWVKITEVEQNSSVAQLMSENKNSQIARKPARGDDIIAFNLF